MELQVENWAGLVFRWAHIIAGIGWIGSSFYFMALDFSLKHREGLPKGAKGESWSVHGGGFYHIQKYMVAPEQMPEDLKWFQWESYATWLTGFALLFVLYYLQADIYLIDRTVMALSKWQAVGLSLFALAASWVVYDILCKSPLKSNQVAMFAALFVLIVGASYLLGQIFSSRAVFLHIGAMIGTIMTGNVFFVIIPNQKVVVADLKAGRTPDPTYGVIAKLRSTHNNYLTLPVLFLMISNHYPMTFGHPWNWVVIAFILPIGAIVRDFFNAHDQGKHGARMLWQWPAASLLLLALMVFVAWRPSSSDAIAKAEALASTTASELDATVLEIVETRCVACHSSVPTDSVSVAPKGVVLETLDQLIQYAPKIHQQTIASTVMPPGNLTEMTEEERTTLAVWLENNKTD